MNESSRTGQWIAYAKLAAVTTKDPECWKRCSYLQARRDDALESCETFLQSEMEYALAGSVMAIQFALFELSLTESILEYRPTVPSYADHFILERMAKETP